MSWIEIALSVVPSRAEVVGELLLRFAPQGLWEAPADRSRRMLRAYVPATTTGRLIIARLRRAVRASFPDCALRTRILRGASWARAWRGQARTVRVGRLIVRRARRTSGAPSRRAGVAIHLDAGMAFGSGDHPSTQLCLRAIDWYVRPGSTVIDLGTGSGILAIAAARLGARRVVALDSDPIAIEVAKANVRSNRVASVVTVRRGNSLAGVHAAADVIVANLTADILPPIAPDVPRRLSPGGRFVASGFGSARSPEVEAAFLRAGLTVTSVERLRGWCAVHGVAARLRGKTLPR